MDPSDGTVFVVGTTADASGKPVHHVYSIGSEAGSIPVSLMTVLCNSSLLTLGSSSPHTTHQLAHQHTAVLPTGVQV